MSRTTIDFGIDLGTTNSAIAVLNGVKPEIIKNNRDQDITPSAVGISKKGELRTGDGAKSMFVGMKDAFVEFKRRMGTEYVYEFGESGISRKPEELSAEILKALRSDVSRTLNEDLQSAVITVPAAFELHQCDATRKAAELAGLKGSPLLMEPTAAALAYGFQIDSEKAYWLVYDFGGGTFDASLIKAEEGLINVVHHGGDNFLGGSDIDWAVLERIIAPKLAQNYDLPDFKRGNARWEKQHRLLKHFIEVAKIELTAKDSASLLGCVFEDGSGDEVDCEEISLTRNDLISIAEPIIRRSTDICLKVLKEKNLSAAGVQKVILVGGPTKAPYFREILQSNLGIPIDFSMDPLTVVAKGAAVFAGTQRIDSKLMRRAQVGEYQIELLKSNKSVGHDTDPLAGGKLSSPDGKSVEGFTIELVNSKTQWRSGKITLRADGTFLVNLLAEKGERNIFDVELYDTNGINQKTVPDHLIYTVGAVVEEQPVIHSVGVALATNEVARFFEKGAGLPQKKKHSTTFHTTQGIKAGEEGPAVLIPIVEGDNDKADRNRLVGHLKITSNLIKRDLVAGSDVEITLKMSESRILTVIAYIPILDEEFEETLDLRKTKVDSAAIEADLKKEVLRLRGLLKKAEDAENGDAVAKLEQIEGSELLIEVKEAVSAAKGDPDAAEKADTRLLELKLRLDEAENILQWPTMVSEITALLDDLDTLVKQHGSDQQQARATELANEVAEIIEKKQSDRLSRKQKQVHDLYFQVLFSIPAYWVNQFQRLERDRAKITDKAEADRLFEMGRNYLEENNVDGLRNVVFKLWDLLPDKVIEDVQRAFGAGLTR